MKLEALSSQELKKMRDDIDAALVVALKREKEEKINQLREKATELGLDINEVMAGASGRKVEPKYEGPNGEKWTSRGRTPRWVLEVIGEDKVDLKNPKHLLALRPYKIK